MEYCPHCSAGLSKADLKKCPYCKKNLDMADWAAVVEPGKTSGKNIEASRKIWLREHSSVIIPILTLLIGFIIGAIFLYSYAQIQFSNERIEYNGQIAQLEKVISQKDENAGSDKKIFEESLAKKDEIIDLLTKQNETMATIINFTRRLARNSTITPNSANEADYFVRNFKYLRNQYLKNNEALSQTDYDQIKTHNLITVPQVIAE